MGDLKNQMGQLIEKASTWFRGLSEREKGLVVGCVAIALGIGLMTLVEEIVPIYENQSIELVKLEKDKDQLPMLLKQYAELAKTKNEIESRFESTGPTVDVPSFLEDVIKNKAGITSKANIRDLRVVELGDRFEQGRFEVSLNTPDLEQVIKFLRGVVSGPQPLLLTRVVITRKGRTLGVTVDLSSIRKKA